MLWGGGALRVCGGRGAVAAVKKRRGREETREIVFFRVFFCVFDVFCVTLLSLARHSESLASLCFGSQSTSKEWGRWAQRRSGRDRRARALSARATRTARSCRRAVPSGEEGESARARCRLQHTYIPRTQRQPPTDQPTQQTRPPHHHPGRAEERDNPNTHPLPLSRHVCAPPYPLAHSPSELAQGGHRRTLPFGQLSAL